MENYKAPLANTESIKGCDLKPIVDIEERLFKNYSILCELRYALNTINDRLIPEPVSEPPRDENREPTGIIDRLQYGNSEMHTELMNLSTQIDRLNSIL